MQELSAGNVKEAMKGSQATSRDLWQVPVDEIEVIEGFNVRVSGAEHREHITTLVKSIMENGFYQSKPLAGYVALVGKKQIIYVTDGHCRLEAVKEAIKQGADIKALPVVVSPKGTSLEDLTVALVASNSGKPLSPYEIGLVCKRLVGFGWDEKTVGQKLGIQPSRVGDLLTLVAAPKDIRNLVIVGAVSATLAIDTIKRHGDGALEKLKAGVDKAQGSGKTRATRKHVDGKPTSRAVVRELVEWAATNKFEDDALGKIVQRAREATS